LSDELALRKQMAQGAQAQATLDNPAIAVAFELLEAEYFKAWKESASTDSEARERLWTAATIVGIVRSHLQQAVSDGKLAQAEIDALNPATPR